MSISTLTNLLTDTLLYGEYKGVPEFVEPYITKERFDNIQAILKRNARYNDKTGNIFLFTGLISCPECGRNLSGNCYSRANKGYAYRCNGHRQQKTCDFNRAVNEKTIEAQLLDNLERYITNYIEVKKIEDKPKTKPKKSQVDAIKKEISRLNSMYRKGRIEEEEYDKDYLALENKLKIAEIEEGEPEQVKDLTHLKELLESDWRGLYEALDRQHKKAFWRRIIKKFTVDFDKKIIEDSIIFF
jgi:hypothetical protein